MNQNWDKIFLREVFHEETILISNYPAHIYFSGVTSICCDLSVLEKLNQQYHSFVNNGRNWSISFRSSHSLFIVCYVSERTHATNFIDTNSCDLILKTPSPYSCVHYLLCSSPCNCDFIHSCD